MVPIRKGHSMRQPNGTTQAFPLEQVLAILLLARGIFNAGMAITSPKSIRASRRDPSRQSAASHTESVRAQDVRLSIPILRRSE